MVAFKHSRQMIPVSSERLEEVVEDVEVEIDRTLLVLWDKWKSTGIEEITLNTEERRKGKWNWYEEAN